MVKLLLRHGAGGGNIDDKTIHGETALMMAAEANKTDVVEILLGGAGVSYSDTNIIN